PDGYGYSRFCELYHRWSRNQDVVLRQEHRAGEKMFVDWARDTIPIHDRRISDMTPASLFVAVLGASTYTFARATLNQDLGNWVDSHVAAFEYFQCPPKLVIPDNPRTGVDRACLPFHGEVDRHYYSVPYPLAGQKLEAAYTATTVEIFDGGKRVGSHARNSIAYRHTAVAEQMAKSPQAHLEWTPSRLIQCA